MKITRSQEQWRTILNEQQASGSTIIDYCREHQLATSSFYIFRKKLGITSSRFIVSVSSKARRLSPYAYISITKMKSLKGDNIK
jgi:hypothetical protein